MMKSSAYLMLESRVNPCQSFRGVEASGEQNGIQHEGEAGLFVHWHLQEHHRHGFNAWWVLRLRYFQRWWRYQVCCPWRSKSFRWVNNSFPKSAIELYAVLTQVQVMVRIGITPVTNWPGPFSMVNISSCSLWKFEFSFWYILMVLMFFFFFFWLDLYEIHT